MSLILRRHRCVKVAYGNQLLSAALKLKTTRDLSGTTFSENAKFEGPIFRQPKATDACFTAKENPGTKRPIQFAINSK